MLFVCSLKETMLLVIFLLTLLPMRDYTSGSHFTWECTPVSRLFYMRGGASFKAEQVVFCFLFNSVMEVLVK